MFYNREKELKALLDVANERKGKAKGILIYGRRRCGKSTLVREAMKEFDGIFI